MENDASYFARREAQERASANSATEREAKAAHLKMAGNYQALAAGKTIKSFVTA